MIENDVAEIILEIADEKGVAPHEVTRDAFRKANEGRVSERELGRLGGFAAVRNHLFPPDVNHAYIQGTKLVKAHRTRLEKEHGTAQYLRGEFLAKIKEVLAAHPIAMHPPVKGVTKSLKKVKRTLNLILSDSHYGANIDGEEMGGLNHFSWGVASRRTAYFVQQAAEYKTHYRNETELVVQLNGDIIAGQIHSQEFGVDLLTDQFVGAMHILSQALSYLAGKFGSVRVVCSPGNHGRNVGKADRGRATIHKYDSYENMLYHALASLVGSVHRNVQFIIPKTPYAVYTAGDRHHIFVTHSDTVVNFGNPGGTIAVKSMREQINNLNASEIVPRGQRLAVVCVGHSHVSNIQLTDEGTAVVMNGTLSGLDQYAQSLGIFGNNPSQTMFESTEAHALGDIRIVQLKTADKMKSLDKIIVPYIRLVDGQ